MAWPTHDLPLGRDRLWPIRSWPPDLDNFGQSNFGQLVFGPANFGSNQFWPIKFGPTGFHTTARELQTRTFEGPGASNTTKIQREDPPERKRRMKFPVGERKKRAKFWAVGGAVQRSGPARRSGGAIGGRRGGPGRKCTRPKNLEENFEHTTHTTHNTHMIGQNTKNTNSGQMRFGQMRA